MYSSYEYCVDDDCCCDHRSGVTRAEGVSLVEAYRALHRASSYRSVIAREDGREIEIVTS